MTTGDKIAAERKKINLTQEQLAYKLEVTRQSVSRWESDLAYPETEKLIKLSELFDCSVDYLLREDKARCETNGGREESVGNGGASADHLSGAVNCRLSSVYYEYKSKKTLFGLPLVHINWGIGRTAKGIIAIGVRAQGFLSIGIFSLGIFSLGVFALGIFAFAAFALAFAAFASVTVAVFSGGAVAIGIMSFGALSVGLFANGACSFGYFVAVGDVAFGQIALAKTNAVGSVYEYVGASAVAGERMEEIYAAIESCVPAFFRPMAKFTVVTGKIILPLAHSNIG